MTPLRRAALRGSLALFAWLYLGTLVVAPLAYLLWNAFAPGLAAFRASVTTAYALAALANTCIVVAVSLAVTVPLGLVTALVLVRDRMPGRRLLDGLVDLPFAAPAAIAAFALILAYGPRGLLGPLFEAAGVKVIFALPGMVLATIFVTLPFVVREVEPILQEMGREPTEAARTLGASRLQTFLWVTIPYVREGILYGTALSYARALGEFGAILAISGNILGMTQTTPIYVYDLYVDFEMHAAFACAAVLVAMSVGGMIVLEGVRRIWAVE